jgi:hypothetical protein
MALIKSPEHVYALMQLIRDENLKTIEIIPDIVTSDLEDIRRVVTTQPRSLPLIAWSQRFIRIGAHVISMIGQHQFDQKAFAELLLRKHAMYGEKPITDWGSLGVSIRIHSKWGRYLNLKETDPGELQMVEAKEDTLTDILGYCVLGLALEERIRYEKAVK